jgi:flagellar biogenesis protein FliO
MSSLRGGFRSVARGVTGSGPAKPPSRAGRVTSNLITVLLLLIAVGLLLRRFGFHHR